MSRRAKTAAALRPGPVTVSCRGVLGSRSVSGGSPAWGAPWRGGRMTGAQAAPETLTALGSDMHRDIQTLADASSVMADRAAG
jgi:hypothetical protein